VLKFVDLLSVVIVYLFWPYLLSYFVSVRIWELNVEVTIVFNLDKIVLDYVILLNASSVVAESLAIIDHNLGFV
jgi:hypothetical protein